MPPINSENPLSPQTLETPDPAPLKPKVESGVKKAPDTTKVTPTVPTKVDYASDYFKALGFDICPKCGGKKQTNGYTVICGIAEPICPMVEKAKEAAEKAKESE